MKRLFYYDTELGRIGIAEFEGEITNLFFENMKFDEECLEKETLTIRRAAKQLNEYLNGERKEFTLVLKPEGTEFQLQVWQALRTIPYGETRTYAQIAEMIGNKGASRAVGLANGKNPISILIPCHRVIGADGKLTGYAGGKERKEKLLNMERENS